MPALERAHMCLHIKIAQRYCNFFIYANFFAIFSIFSAILDYFGKTQVFAEGSAEELSAEEHTRMIPEGTKEELNMN